MDQPSPPSPSPGPLTPGPVTTVATAQEHAAAIPPDRLARLGAFLAPRLSREVLFSTLVTGARRDDLREETIADLADLGRALPEGRLSTALRDRDAASDEAEAVTFIRQAEGMPPALPGVLCPRTASEVADLRAEASAAGYAPVGRGGQVRQGGTGRQAGQGRPIGLSFAGAQWTEAARDEVRFGAGASWGGLIAAAARVGGILPAAALVDRYPLPIDAGVAGLLPTASVTEIEGVPAEGATRLAPAEVGVTDKTWVMRDPKAAAEAFARTVALYRPLYAELIPPLDAEALAAAGLWRPGRRVTRGGGALRVVLAGTASVRRAALAAASWRIERTGGVCRHRGSLPPASALPALAAAAGACRMVLPTGWRGRAPEGAVRQERRVAVDGEVRAETVLWYARDLSRSLEEAQGLTAPSVEDDALPSPRPPDPGSRGPGSPEPQRDEWDALREALAAAMP